MKTNSQNLFAALALLAFSTLNPQLSTASAQGTTAFTYQGQLRNSGTNASGTYGMIFSLYDAVTNGNQIGPAITNNLTLVNGVFAANLDFGAGAFDGNARWLDIAVTNGLATQELSPRVPVLSTPYAQFAAVAAIVTNGAIETAQIANGAITGAKISGGAVTATDIAGGQVVKSLDGLNDAVSLVAGANVTLSTNGNTLIIASAAGGGSASFVPNVQVFDTPGAYQFTVPTNVTRIMVEVWGGGGGGGSGDYAAYQGGGGGGAGGYGKEVFTVTPGTAYNVVIGGGGSSDNPGTNSYFGALISTTGGHSGDEDYATSGTGGKGGGSTASINITGGTGIFPFSSYGGDGGNAGCGGNGGKGDAETGIGAEPGQIPGGGGGGGSYNGTGGLYGSGTAGAPGGHGRVVVYY